MDGSFFTIQRFLTKYETEKSTYLGAPMIGPWYTILINEKHTRIRSLSLALEKNVTWPYSGIWELCSFGATKIAALTTFIRRMASSLDGWVQPL